MYNKHYTRLVYLPCRIIAHKEAVDHHWWWLRFKRGLPRLYKGNISRVFNKKQSTFYIKKTQSILILKKNIYVTRQKVEIDKEKDCSIISMTPCCDKKEWMQKPPTEGVRIKVST